jgi:competence protein ComEA
VPTRGAAAASGGTASPSAPLDLNTASLEQLDTLPGIGPSTAQKILDYRQEHGAFHSLADLDAVSGIGPSRLAQLKGLVIP